MDYIDLKIFAINLQKYNTIEDYTKLLKDNKLDSYTFCIEDLATILMTYRTAYTTVYLNAYNGMLIAATRKDSTFLQPEQTKEYFNKISPIKMDLDNIIEEKLSIDTILDKINDGGMESLSTKEKYFLKKYDK